MIICVAPSSGAADTAVTALDSGSLHSIGATLGFRSGTRLAILCDSAADVPAMIAALLADGWTVSEYASRTLTVAQATNDSLGSYVSGRNGWEHVSIDFTADTTADLDPTSSTFEAGGYTWNQGTTANMLADLDKVEGTGLVALASTTISRIRYRTTSGWWAGLPLADVWSDFDARDVLVIRAKVASSTSYANNGNQIAIGLGNGLSSSQTRHVACSVGNYGSQGANRFDGNSTNGSADANTPKGSFDCLQIVMQAGGMRLYAGVLASGEYPSTWTGIGNAGGTELIAPLNQTTTTAQPLGDDCEVILMATPGLSDTSGTFECSWSQLDLYRLPGTGVMP